MSGACPGLCALERRRRHADDREDAVADRDGLADGGRTAAEAALPVAIADDRRRRRWRQHVVGRPEQPPGGRLDPENACSTRRTRAPPSRTLPRRRSRSPGRSADCAKRAGNRRDVVAKVLEQTDRKRGLDALPAIRRVICTSRSGSFTGRARSITALIRLKMAALAPMPSASESTATAANPGFRRSVRTA